MECDLKRGQEGGRSVCRFSPWLYICYYFLISPKYQTCLHKTIPSSCTRLPSKNTEKAEAQTWDSFVSKPTTRIDFIWATVILNFKIVLFLNKGMTSYRETSITWPFKERDVITGCFHHKQKSHSFHVREILSFSHSTMVYWGFMVNMTPKQNPVGPPDAL